MMENVIEKQYIPFESNMNRGIDAGTLALLKDNNPGMAEMMAMMNGNGGGFGGNGQNGIWFIFLLLLFGMGGRGNGLFGGNGNVPAELNNDYNTNLLMQAINGNKESISQLSTTLNCDLGRIENTLCSIRGGIDKVAGEVGYTGERVINAVQMGDCNIISKLQDCCCATQRSIDAVNLNLTRMSYEDQLAVQAQTNQLSTVMNTGFNGLAQRIDAQSMAMTQGFQGVKDLFTQQKIDSLQAVNAQYSNQLSQQAQTAAIRDLIDPLKAELASIQCGLPKQAIPAYPVNCGYPYGPYTGGLGYNGSGCSGC